VLTTNILPFSHHTLLSFPCTGNWVSAPNDSILLQIIISSLVDTISFTIDASLTLQTCREIQLCNAARSGVRVQGLAPVRRYLCATTSSLSFGFFFHAPFSTQDSLPFSGGITTLLHCTRRYATSAPTIEWGPSAYKHMIRDVVGDACQVPRLQGP
jgi:hypothetical protein